MFQPECGLHLHMHYSSVMYGNSDILSEVNAPGYIMAEGRCFCNCIIGICNNDIQILMVALDIRCPFLSIISTNFFFFKYF